jgi:hypothetical protein
VSIDRTRPLVYACGAFMTGNLLHLADHLRRGWGLPLYGLTPQVFWGGGVITLAAAVTFALAIRGSRRAAQVALGVGFVSAIAVSAAHFAPPWGAFSNSYLVLPVDLLAWAAALSEVLGALSAGIVGLRIVQRRRPTQAL